MPPHTTSAFTVLSLFSLCLSFQLIQRLPLVMHTPYHCQSHQITALLTIFSLVTSYLEVTVVADHMSDWWQEGHKFQDFSPRGISSESVWSPNNVPHKNTTKK